MYRSHPSATPHAASHLPPLSAVGWFVTIRCEPDHRRDDRSGSGEFSDPSRRVSVEPARPDGKARQWKHPFAPALDWLRRVLGMRIWSA